MRGVVALAAAAMLGGAQAKAPGLKDPHSGIYCVREPHHALRYFLEKREPDGRLAFGVSHWWPNGALTGADGIAMREGDHWKYIAPREAYGTNEPYPSCIVRIWLRPGGGARIEADKTAPCVGGYNEVLGTLSFPRSAYWAPVTHELDYLEGVKDAPTIEEQPDLCGRE